VVRSQRIFRLEDFLGNSPKKPNSALKAFRETKGLSQSAMAGKLGITQSTYSHYEIKETSRLPLDILRKLAQMGLDLNWLYLGNGWLGKGSIVEEPPNQAYSPKPLMQMPDAEALEHADMVIEKLVPEAKNVPGLRYDLQSAIAADYCRLRELGHLDQFEASVERWLRAARKFPGKPKQS
jgi:transcriptional regulator with XRE-family HTH domain